MERYRFFDSVDGEDEREYTADEFAEYFRQFIRNGIFTGGENLKVETDKQDMKVFIKPGYAFIEGYLYKIDTEPLVIQHNIADPSLNRIDRIVIKLDKTLENRYVKAFILEGTPAVTPETPTLTRNNNVYEISLAQVEIIAGKSFIESYQIIDERLNNDVCGITTHLFEQVDTTDIFNEWQNYLDFKKNESNSSYADFVAELQSKLNVFQQTWDNWVEDKISEPAGKFYAEWKAWFNEIEDTTNLVTLSQFNEFKNTKGEPDGVASLDINAQIPSEQLGNVKYLKDFHINNEISFNFIGEVYERVKCGGSTDLFQYMNYDGTDSNFSSVDLENSSQIDFVCSSTFGDSSTSYPQIQHQSDYIRIYARSGSDDSTSYNRIVYTSKGKYDLTNIDYIDIDCLVKFYGLSVSSSTCKIGLSKEDQGYSDFESGATIEFSSSVDRGIQTLDVSNLSGEYYLKFYNYVYKNNVTSSYGYIYTDLYGIKFINNSFSENLSTSNKGISLGENALSGEFTLPELRISSGFTKWHSLNVHFNNPAGTEIKFDVLDNYGNLLKENVQNGVILKEFANPIIRPKITLSRSSLETPSPSLSWLSVNKIFNNGVQRADIAIADWYEGAIYGFSANLFENYDGSDGTFNSTDLEDSSQIDFVCSSVSSSVGSTYPRVYHHPTYIQMYARSNTDDSSTYNIITYASKRKYDLTNIDYIKFDCSTTAGYTSSSSAYSVIGVSTNQSSNSYGNFEKYIRNTSSTDRQIETLDVRDLTGEYYIVTTARMGKGYIEDGRTYGYVYLYLYGMELIGNGKGVFLQEDELQKEISFNPLNTPRNFLCWNTITAFNDLPNNTNAVVSMYDDNGELLKENVKNGERLKNFTDPTIYPKVILSRDNLETPSPIFKWLEVGMNKAEILDPTEYPQWEIISELILENDTNEIEFTDLDQYRELRMIVVGTVTYTGTRHLNINFNGNEAGHVFYTVKLLPTYSHVGNGSAGAEISISDAFTRGDSGTYRDRPETSIIHILQSRYKHRITGWMNRQITYGTYEDNNPIETMRIYPSSSSISAGSSILLLGVK